MSALTATLRAAQREPDVDSGQSVAPRRFNLYVYPGMHGLVNGIVTQADVHGVGVPEASAASRCRVVFLG